MATPVSITNLSSHVQDQDELSVSVAVTNNSLQPRVVKVAWYLSNPDDKTPWLTGYFASSWQSRVVGPSSTMVFRSRVLAAIPSGAYQLSAYLHGPGNTNPVQYDQATSDTMVNIVNHSDFLRAITPGPAFVTRVTIPKGSNTKEPLLNVKADVSLKFPTSVRLPVSLAWDLVAKGTLRSNSWDSASTLISGIKYPVHSPSTNIAISSEAIGVPGRNYALRLRVYIGRKLSDTIIVRTTDFLGGGLSPSVDRTFYPSANIPLIITSLSLPSRWRVGSFASVSVTVTNISHRQATGQLILQVGHVGDPTPWRDPSYTFPSVTFAVPARTTQTIHDSGDPVMNSGQYELGVYVHYESGDGKLQPGDQVFARSRVTFDGAS